MKRATYETLARVSTPAAVSSHQRLTAGDLRGLKDAQLKEDPIRKMFEGIRHELGALFGSLFFGQPQKTNSMCKYYGHVIRGPWAGFLPVCADCGVKIHTSAELRKAISNPAAARKAADAK